MHKPALIETMEPVLEIKLIPSYDLRKMKDVIYVREGSEYPEPYAEISIYVWINGTVTSQYYSLSFNKKELEKLLSFLQKKLT
jgi:hypothetical protein